MFALKPNYLRGKTRFTYLPGTVRIPETGSLGGAPPVTWFVNGEPIGEADQRRQSAW